MDNIIDQQQIKKIVWKENVCLLNRSGNIYCRGGKSTAAKHSTPVYSTWIVNR